MERPAPPAPPARPELTPRSSRGTRRCSRSRDQSQTGAAGAFFDFAYRKFVARLDTGSTNRKGHAALQKRSDFAYDCPAGRGIAHVRDTSKDRTELSMQE